MSTIQLTSYERMRRYLSPKDAGTALTDQIGVKRDLTNWIASVSRQIEQYLDRDLLTASYTEYFDIGVGQVRFEVHAPPVTTLTSVYVDWEGAWDGGSEDEVTDCFAGVDGRTVVLPCGLGMTGDKAIRVIYTGGLAYSGPRSVFTISGSAGTWTAGNYVKGGTSDAVGIVRASTATTLTVEILFGVFVAAETLTEYSDESGTTAGDASATLATVTQQSLAESYPDIVRAAEIQVRYLWQHKGDMETTGINKDGTTMRREGWHSTFMVNAGFQDETVALLAPYRRVLVV